jgi:hypothetical protein
MDLLFIDDLFNTEESMEAYKTTSYPFNLSLVKERLDARLQEDPEYEVFLPVSYYPYEAKVTDKLRRGVITPYGYFISNKGNVYTSFYKKIMKPGLNTSGYRQANMPHNGKQVGFAVNRMVACAFIPLKEHHTEAALHPKDLEVNHINGIKPDNDYSNLEWVTKIENAYHAVEIGLKDSGEAHKDTKPLKGRVIRGNHIGFEFVVYGGNHLESFGFDQAACSNAANGKLKSHGNCRWSFATEEERNTLPRVIPADVLKDIQETCPIAKYRTVGKNILTGEIVSFIGVKQCRAMGFNPTAIGNMIAGRTASHKGYTWKYELLETEL